MEESTLERGGRLLVPSSLPTGVVTFLFSDIEGSTALWEAYPVAMQISLRRHDELLHAAVIEHGGHVFKTVGDEFCTVFHAVPDAIEAAIAAQRAIAADDWSAIGGLRVRMAIHCGRTDERGGDYYGPTVNRVARLLATAHGGQIVLSGATADIARDTLPGGANLRDLGRHRLKDLAELEQIYQIVAPNIPEIFPPLRTMGAHPNNLPQQLTKVLGRDADLADVKGLLDQTALLTIVGAGGVGKTTVALQVAADILETYEDGVWFVELASLSDPALVPSAIAAAIGVTESPTRPVLETLVAYLKSKSALIVLDNCEHLVSGAAHAVNTIALACAQVRFLCTTREPLAIAGERVYRMPSLAVPPPGIALTVNVALSYGAIALFVERARAQVPAFELTAENAPILADICRRLDGIALAIELAAARVRVLSLPQLSERLAERFRILTGGSRTALPRQQTMRALIDWSYDLLSEDERKVFRRISVFAGGCSLSATIDVCSDDSLEAWDLLDHLTSLVDKSLVVADSDGAEQRYRMLESTRQYASERLLESGEADTIAHKHVKFYLDLAGRADAAWSSTSAKEWIAPLTIELDNFRAALAWSMSARNDVLLGLSLLGSLEAFWWDAQPIEGRRWIGEALPLVLELNAPRELAKFWLAAANVALTLRQQKTALEAGEHAVKAFTDLGDADGIAAAWRCLGAALINLGRIDEGEALAERALETFRSRENRRLIALALRTLAGAATLHGKLEKAGELYREALALANAIFDERGMKIINANLAEIEFATGNTEAALEHAYESLELARQHRDVFVCGSLLNISAYLIALTRFEEARSAAREAIAVARDIENDLYLAIAIQHLGAVSAACGNPVRAARLLAYSDVVYAAVESQREPTEAKEYEEALAAIRDRAGDDDVARSFREGGELTADRAVAEALLV